MIVLYVLIQIKLLCILDIQSIRDKCELHAFRLNRCTQ